MDNALAQLKHAFATMSAVEADSYDFAIYDANTGKKYRLVDAYYADAGFYLDIEPDES